MVIPEYVDIYISAEVSIQNQSIDNNKLRDKIYEILKHAFMPSPHKFEDRIFQGWDYGKTVYKSEVISIIKNVEGVEYVGDVNLEAGGSYGSFKKDTEGNLLFKNSNLVVLNNLDISFV